MVRPAAAILFVRDSALFPREVIEIQRNMAMYSLVHSNPTRIDSIWNLIKGKRSIKNK